MMSTVVQCQKCGAVLHESPQADPRLPCPSCGSTARTFGVGVPDKVSLSEVVKARVKRQGRSKPKIESIGGDELHRQSGKVYKKERVIDQEKNRYRERITDPETGQVIRDVDEPLTAHRGRGSAKKPKPK